MSAQFIDLLQKTVYPGIIDVSLHDQEELLADLPVGDPHQRASAPIGSRFIVSRLSQVRYPICTSSVSTSYLL